MTDEKDLIQKCIEGNRLAMKQLFQIYYGLTMITCNRYIESKETAQDVAQEVMIKVFDHLKNFKHNSSLKTWITSICINECLRFLKEKNIFKLVETSELEVVDVYIDESDLAYQIDSELVLEFIKKLPVGYRTVLNLFAIENYSHAEISAFLGISEGTSKSQLSKARQLLKKTIIEHSLKSEKSIHG